MTLPMAEIIENLPEEISTLPEEREGLGKFRAKDTSLEGGGVRKALSREQLQALARKPGVAKEVLTQVPEGDNQVTNEKTQQLVQDLKLTGDPDQDLPKIMDAQTSDYAAVTDLANEEMFNSEDRDQLES